MIVLTKLGQSSLYVIMYIVCCCVWFSVWYWFSVHRHFSCAIRKKNFLYVMNNTRLHIITVVVCCLGGTNGHHSYTFQQIIVTEQDGFTNASVQNQ